MILNSTTRYSLVLTAVMAAGLARETLATESPETRHPDQSGTQANVPSEAAWSGIRAAHERARHSITLGAHGYQTRNPSQRWQTEFDGRGFLVRPDGANWQWGLEVQSYGFSGYEQTVTGEAPAITEGSRLEYAWNENLQEWFINDRPGLEHGLTLKNRPPGASGPLQFTLAVRGDLRPEVDLDRLGVRFLDSTGAMAVTYRGLQVFDANHRSIPATFEPSTDLNAGASRANGSDFEESLTEQTTFFSAARVPALRIIIDDGEAQYPLTIDPLAQQAYLKASNAEAGDAFGSAVAVSGDTVVVGAYLEDSKASGIDGNQSDNTSSNSGAAYIFVRQGTSWTQQAYLKASNSGAEDLFGASVSISGDTVVVGAPLEDSSSRGINGNQNDEHAEGAGAAYVFVRHGSTWNQQAYLKASNTGAGDLFGAAVAVADNTIIVGAYLEASNATGINGSQNNNGAPNSGAAYIFVRNGEAWAQQAYLKASNAETGDYFGSTVALSGNTALVGAVSEDSDAAGVNGSQNNNGVTDSGAAYVFFRTGSTWKQQAYLKATAPGTSDYFGFSVALSGDTAVVGANWEDSNAAGLDGDPNDNSASNAGAAYVFTRTGTTWSSESYLKASNPGANDHFGAAVGVSGRIIVVGAPAEDGSQLTTGLDPNNDNALDSGAVYIWDHYTTIPPTLFNPAFEGTQFSARILTEAGKTYIWEFKPALEIATWTEVTRVQGNGTEKKLTDPNAIDAQRFYRVRIE